MLDRMPSQKALGRIAAGMGPGVKIKVADDTGAARLQDTVEGTALQVRGIASLEPSGPIVGDGNMGLHAVVVVGQKSEAHAVAGDDGLHVVEEKLEDLPDGFPSSTLRLTWARASSSSAAEKSPASPSGWGKSTRSVRWEGRWTCAHSLHSVARVRSISRGHNEGTPQHGRSPAGG